MIRDVDADRRTLRFCHQDEEHDPSEEFEEYMACAVCGDNCKLFICIMDSMSEML